MNRKGFFTKRTLSNLLVVCLGILLYVGLANFGAIRTSLRWFVGIFRPFFLAVAFAYLLNMPMRLIENRFLYKLKHKRGLSILLAFLFALLVLGLLVGMLMPQLVQSVVSLVRNIPVYLQNLNDLVDWLGQSFDLGADVLEMLRVSYTDLINELMAWAREALPNLLNWTMEFGSGIVSLLTAIIASIYMLFSKEKLLVQLKRVVYAILPVHSADELMRIGGLSNRVFSGFIGGKIADSAIIGLICFLFMSLMNAFVYEMPFALLISVIIGVTNIIPFFGPFIGAIPSAMILLLANPWSALWFVVFVLLLQQFDGNILGPKILGNSTGLPALWVLVAIIVGGGLFGFMGMLLGVPTAAVLYSVVSEVIAKRLQKRNLGNLGREEEAPPQAPAAGPPAPAAVNEDEATHD